LIRYSNSAVYGDGLYPAGRNVGVISKDDRTAAAAKNSPLVGEDCFGTSVRAAILAWATASRVHFFGVAVGLAGTIMAQILRPTSSATIGSARPCARSGRELSDPRSTRYLAPYR